MDDITKAHIASHKNKYEEITMNEETEQIPIYLHIPKDLNNQLKIMAIDKDIFKKDLVKILLQKGVTDHTDNKRSLTEN